MTHEIWPIRNDADHAEALAAIEGLWQATPGTPEHNRLKLLAMLVEDYESRRWPSAPAEPVDLIRYVMEQHDLTPKGPGGGAWLARPLFRDPEPSPPAPHEDGMASAPSFRHPGRCPDPAVRPRPLSGGARPGDLSLRIPAELEARCRLSCRRPARIP
jgi:HTH-type transcriptional regulator/antitoxin HigA